jgi:hypothetical protein
MRRFQASSFFEAAGIAAAAAERTRHNLLLIHRKTKGRDLEAVCRYIREVAPDVVPFVLRDRRRSRFHPALLRRRLRPTLAVSFLVPRHFHPSLEALYHGRLMSKSEEYAALESAGIPVPRWTLLHRGEEPCLDGFGEYVVSKPDRGRAGAEVRIRRASRVRRKPRDTGADQTGAEVFPDLIIQDFVYTGRWPVSYRVTTLFGEVLFALRMEAEHSRRPLEGPAAFQGGGISIVSSAKGATYTMLDDPEIIALGERAHAAFPGVPILGIDIVRDCETGKLYVLEANAAGGVWHFNSRQGREVQEMWNLDFEAQFDGIRKAAYILVDRTRQLAR